jgi:hypothetical protein
MSDLPILASRREAPRQRRELLARNEPKANRGSLLSECSRENLKFVFLARMCGGNRGKGDHKPMTSTSGASRPAGGDGKLVPEVGLFPFSSHLFNGNRCPAGGVPPRQNPMRPPSDGRRLLDSQIFPLYSSSIEPWKMPRARSRTRRLALDVNVSPLIFRLLKALPSGNYRNLLMRIYFTPPAARPCTISRWMTMVSAITGSMTTIAAAASGPQAKLSKVSML